MRKQELLDKCRELNLRPGDKVKVRFTEEGKRNYRLYSINKEFKGIDIEDEVVEFYQDGMGWSHFNVYGEQKRTKSTGASIRNCSLWFSFNDVVDSCLAEWIEDIENLTNTSRRRKNNWLAIENYE